MNIIFEGYVSFVMFPVLCVLLYVSYWINNIWLYVSYWINNIWLTYLDIAVRMWSYGATVLDV